jgi:hypothetical protein
MAKTNPGSSLAFHVIEKKKLREFGDKKIV